MQKLFLGLLIIIGFTSNAQSSALDKGFSVLHIDAKMADVKKYLIAADTASLLDMNNKEWIGSMITSAWTLDLKKAKAETFHGLTVQRIEVYFDGEQDENGKPQAENIFSFVIWLEKPDKEHEQKFTDELFATYGDAVPEASPDGMAAALGWFSHITLMNVSFGADMETGEHHNFFLVRFDQGYGG